MSTTEIPTELPHYDFNHYKLAIDAVASLPSPISALKCSLNDKNDMQKSCSENIATLPSVKCAARARIPTTTGAELWLHVYRNNVDSKEHLAFVFGNQVQSQSLNCVREGETEMDRMIRGAYSGRLRPGRISSHDDQVLFQKPAKVPRSTPKLVRVHSECYTGETAWSARCDCGEQLDEAANMMIESGGGVIVYLRQEGRGIGLTDKLKAYNLQDMGLDTVDANIILGRPADARTYGMATAILLDLGLGNDSGCRGIQLLTNNPDKIEAIKGPHGELTVKERVPMVPITWGTSKNESLELHQYLRTKIDKMGHLL
ncbi:hypothetical protein DTO013E5_9184 [Penicillium roqueforti]|nr:hypothetical protein DTO012A1_8720 [Penicillium roqueforti]KAI2740244.1 hypothetical protein DTO013F2_9127 [Penicillium roqueforti]KAI2756328.1 hypothetical protein DTO006G1_7968 [Penicillium roqueforti]KAI2767198.1 hypothetical protein DTO012A8_7588 [Penicillium roqueforti]KAI3199913.1 hypothetical protein DTO013E5_9184 [Penicillium roqueforti]